jgi:hypothetical protein
VELRFLARDEAERLALPRLARMPV